jgi:hypothetical protein
MYIRRLLYNPYSSIIISMLLGFGLATLFRKTCSIRGCYVFKGPSIDKIEGQTFQMDNKCYKYNYSQRKCKGTSAKIINFASAK